MLATAKTHHSSPVPVPRRQDHPLRFVIHLMSSPIWLQMSQPPGCPAPPVDTWSNGREIILISHSISANQIASHVTSLICKHPVHILMGSIMSDLHTGSVSLNWKPSCQLWERVSFYWLLFHLPDWLKMKSNDEEIFKYPETRLLLPVLWDLYLSVISSVESPPPVLWKQTLCPTVSTSVLWRPSYKEEPRCC